MRVTSMMAGLAIVLAACGGEKKAGTPAAGGPDTVGGGAPAAAPAAEAPAAGGGANHDVTMSLNGSKYQFEPAELTIKAGETVTFHNKSGGPHNVSFWADSIPKGADAVLKTAMPDQMAPLEGPLLTEQDGTYKITFTGAPTGDYKFYCLPHLALGMHGKITVQ
jgi:plastocyanin